MADILYTHRIAKLLEEFVVSAGLVVHISDETSTSKLGPQILTIQQMANRLDVSCTHQTNGAVTIVTFARKS